MASELRLAESQDSMAMKLKAGLMGAQGQGQGREGEDRRRDEGGFPGDKLPEHHFKKKYFNAEFQVNIAFLH